MPFVIPYFIPHQGCPHQCLFCNQRSITGKGDSLAAVEQDIENTISLWLHYRRMDRETQFAFYGGSFTCLSEKLQTAMLKAVQPWLRNKEINLIRLSTRPDCIDSGSAEFLRRYGVGVVELGVQSLDDKVLAAALRGHNADDCAAAVHHLDGGTFQIGIQLMPGLPGESRASFFRTVRQTIALRPSFVRIYPTVVVEHSGLAEQYKKGEFEPLSLGMATVLVSRARHLFEDAGIGVVRMGLQHSTMLEKNVLAGPYHPAFGELVLARQWLGRVRYVMSRYPGKRLRITISDKDISCFNGIKRANRVRLQELGLEERLEIMVDKTMARGRMQYVVC